MNDMNHTLDDDVISRAPCTVFSSTNETLSVASIFIFDIAFTVSKL